MSSRISEVLSVLQVLRSTRGATSNAAAELRTQRIAAVKQVAEARRITPDTVRDACTRQLKPEVKGTRDFDGLVRVWLLEESSGLKNVLLRHTADETDAAAVERFFAR